ncbi:MAG: peptidoglycan-binding protein [Phycisphaerales bacterium]
MSVVTVRQGDCIYSIAAEHGLFWKTIWNHPENEDLRRLRVDPNLLMPGDEVFVREREERLHPAGTESRHRFRHKGVPANLKVRILLNGEPRKNEAWHAELDGKRISGTTDGDGILELAVNPRIVSVLVNLASGYRILLQVRHLDPLDTISGVQARLNNLGYESGPVDNIQGPITTEAIKRFQADYPPLAVDGIVGPHTRGKLKEVYGC